MHPKYPIINSNIFFNKKLQENCPYDKCIWLSFSQASQIMWNWKKKQNEKPQYHPVIMGSDAMDTVSEQLKKNS